jgi:hypothetical protein
MIDELLQLICLAAVDTVDGAEFGWSHPRQLARNDGDESRNPSRRA